MMSEPKGAVGSLPGPVEVYMQPKALKVTQKELQVDGDRRHSPPIRALTFQICTTLDTA